MLYIVGTPIGNINDISIRAAHVLNESDIILCEDTRTTGTFLQKIKSFFSFPTRHPQRLISYYKEKEFQKLPEVLELLKSGKNISIISQSGMPLIADPGYLLIQTLIKEKIPYTVIPGPTAAVSALVLSGFDPQKFLFLGFFPKKTSESIRLIDQLNTINELLRGPVFIFYESPHRIVQTLELLAQHLPQADIALCREITKKFEEVTRGKPKNLLGRTYKGEITLVIRLAK